MSAARFSGVASSNQPAWRSFPMNAHDAVHMGMHVLDAVVGVVGFQLVDGEQPARLDAARETPRGDRLPVAALPSRPV